MGWPTIHGLFGTAMGRLTPERGNLTSLAEVAILSHYRGSGGEGGQEPYEPAVLHKQALIGPLLNIHHFGHMYDFKSVHPCIQTSTQMPHETKTAPSSRRDIKLWGPCIKISAQVKKFSGGQNYPQSHPEVLLIAAVAL